MRRLHIALAVNDLPASEDDGADGFASEADVNGVEWELFSPADQDRAIVEHYGATTA